MIFKFNILTIYTMLSFYTCLAVYAKTICDLLFENSSDINRIYKLYCYTTWINKLYIKTILNAYSLCTYIDLLWRVVQNISQNIITILIAISEFQLGDFVIDILFYYRDTYFMLGLLNEKKTNMDDIAGLTPDAR